MKEYPLAWPDGWPRAKSRKRATFSKHGRELSYRMAEERLISELERLNGGRRYAVLVISSNMLRENRLLNDPGAAVYFQKGGEKQPTRVMAIDAYDRVADNIAALAATVEAMRAIERHGGAQILERAFTGFDALPSPKDWRQILRFHRDQAVTLAEAETMYRDLAKLNHPDHGGSSARMAEINEAIAAARKELT